MPDSVSILIPTHNRAPILVKTLESLRAMELPAGRRVELIVVANACTDETKAVVERLAPSMPFPARCVEEPAVGLNHARNRAIVEATGEILAFLDDDVAVDGGWLAGLVEVFDGYPADLVGGRVRLWWEAVQRPEWMDDRSEQLLSAVDHGEAVCELRKPGLVIGANMAFRRRVVERVGIFSAGLDRAGGAVIGGGDTNFMARALAGGHRIFYAPRASLRHWVAPGRIEPRYLLAAARGNGLIRPFLRERFSTPAGLLLALRYGFRGASYSALAAAAAFFRNRKATLHYRIRRADSMGTAVGAWRRIRKRAPNGGPGAALGADSPR